MSRNDIYSLDLETAPTDPTDTRPVALEPWRLPMGQAQVTDISISGPDNYSKLIKYPTKEEVHELVVFLEDKVVYMHNALFDTAWLYAITQDVIPLAKIRIRDTMLLAKWIYNSQAEQFATKEHHSGGYSLKALVNRVIPDHPGAQEFIEMKKEEHVAGQDAEYWEKRALADTYFTRHLAIKLQSILPAEQRNGYLISQKQIPYVARAWVEGSPFDLDKVNELIPKVETAKKQLAEKLGLAPTVMSSPQQLSNLLFNEWGLTPLNFGKPSKKTGIANGSTAAGDLKMLAIQSQGTAIGPKMKLIMDFKKLQTLHTKYLNGFQRVNEYVGSPTCHGSPRIFGTYTGRYTYASKTLKKQIYQTSIAMHQLPRKGPAKGLMIGDKVGKYDASGQEIAFMAWASRDANMLSVLNQGMNVHSWMATNLTGEGYQEFIDRLHSDDPDAYNTRQAAKLLNLSCQYRIGWKSLLAKFFENYDKIISRAESMRYLGIYTGAYTDIPKYWKNTCIEAQKKGYAETIAGRRYYLSDWQSHRWATESSAINTPIQGSGADQKDLIIWLVSKKFPELQFTLDIHDEGIFYLPPEDAEELNKEVVHFLNGINYNYYWNTELPMPLQFEGQLGDNFKDCVEYAQSFEEIQRMKGLI